MSWDMEQFYRNLSTGGEEYQIKEGRNGYITKIIDPRCSGIYGYRSKMTTNGIATGEESLREDFVGCKRGAQELDISMSLNYGITRTQPHGIKDLNPKYWFNYARPTSMVRLCRIFILEIRSSIKRMEWRRSDHGSRRLFPCRYSSLYGLLHDRSKLYNLLY